MAENEKTSPRVASIASKVLNMNKPLGITVELWEDIRTLAASALTQTSDHKETKYPLAKAFMDSKKIDALGTKSENITLDPMVYKKMFDFKKLKH